MKPKPRTSLKIRRPRKPTSGDPQINLARERARRHYIEHQAERLAYAAEYRKENKAKVSHGISKWASKNKEHLAAYKKRYAVENKTVIDAYKQKHQQEKAEYQAAYVKSHREEILQQRRAYYQTQKGRASVTNSNHRRRAILESGPATTEQILKLQAREERCYYCRGYGLKLTIDHFMPISRGGLHSIENLVMACRSCNSHKKDKDPHEFMRSIGRRPRRKKIPKNKS